MVLDSSVRLFRRAAVQDGSILFRWILGKAQEHRENSLSVPVVELLRSQTDAQQSNSDGSMVFVTLTNQP
jgi:hypothetical protein